MKPDDLDRKIQHALSAEDAELFGEGGEMAMFEMMIGSFKSRTRGWMIYAMVMTTVFTVIMFYCIYRAFTAPENDVRILWCLGVLFAGIPTGMLKLWWFMQMDKHNVLREIKRVELQIATLASRMKQG
ncbi:MAG: hypothetical protein H6813_07350 [Phycisphaeraceae bacterium]|nr:hypothetical protein [Phycisphaeraceae bacterium]MCB9848311.1 hypothetical protein [Phycisphaeraceae bacterium]